MYDCRVSLLYKSELINVDHDIVKINSVEIISDNWRWMLNRSLFDSDFKKYMLIKAKEVGIPAEGIERLSIDRIN